MVKEKKTKTVKAKDLRGKTQSELMTALIGLRKESMNLRFKRMGGEFKTTDRIGKIRKEIARIKTVMTELGKKDAPKKETKKAAAPKAKAPAKAKAKKEK